MVDEQVRRRNQRNKANGRDAENTVARGVQRWVRSKIERRAKTGAKDQGDIAGWAGVCVEVKYASKGWNVTQWLRELKVEIEHAGADIGFVAVRTKGSPNFDQMVAIMPMPEFMELMVDAGWADHLPAAETDKQGDNDG